MTGKNKYIFGVAIIFVMATSCKHFKTQQTSEPIAQVGEKVLTLNELTKATPSNMNSNDSLAFTQNFINRWVKAELLLHKAELNLTPEEKDVEKILENYRASLLIHKYQQKLLLQKYSPLITYKEIEEYYNKMQENFVLESDIIQGVFIQVPTNAPKLDQLKKWYQSTEPEDSVSLEDYCYQYAKKFDNFLDKWVTVDQINRLLPQPIPNSNSFLKYNNRYEVSDSLTHFFVSFRNYKKANEIAPLGYVEDKIKAILLNKKRIDFIKNLEEELYQEGLKQKVIKFY